MSEDEGSWRGCDSKSNMMCLARRCIYANVLYFLDDGSPEIECHRPKGKNWRDEK